MSVDTGFDGEDEFPIPEIDLPDASFFDFEEWRRLEKKV